MFHLLVLLNIIASNFYGVYAITLDTALLSQFGYNNESSDISFNLNNIDDIDPNAFKGYMKVTALKLQINQLSKVDLGLFEDMVNLTYLDLSYNPLIQLTNSKKIVFSSMLSLGLSAYSLTNFDLNVINALPNLKLFDGNLLNPIKPNQLSPWKKLQTLYIITKNQTSLTKEHFSGLNSLNELAFRVSNIKTMEVHSLLAMPNLLSVDLSNNELTSFEYLQIPTKLTTLNLQWNKMNYFMLSRTIGVIKDLYINNNMFRSFKSMDFTFLTNLTFLSLSNNPHAYPNEIAGHLKPLVNLIGIQANSLSINTIDSNFFKQNTKLTTISLNSNKISILPFNTFSHLKVLSNLDLSNNQISVLDNRTFFGLNFVVIMLNSNRLTKIATSTFYNQNMLFILDLSNNLISEIDSSAFTGCYNLRHLNLENNQLTNLLPRIFEDLTIISLSLKNNQITELDNSSFTGVKIIESINLSNNNISRIDQATFNSFKMTNSLTLYGNRLTKLENGTFAGQNQLNSIDLGFNKIDTIEAETFNGLTNLQNIYLQSNNLTQLDSSTFDGCNNLQGIYLANNPTLITVNLQSLCPTAAVNCKVYY